MPIVPTTDCLNGGVQITKLPLVCQPSLSQQRGSPQSTVPNFVPRTNPDGVALVSRKPLVPATQCHSGPPLRNPCKSLIYRAATATNQKVGSSNLSGRTIFSIQF